MILKNDSYQYKANLFPNLVHLFNIHQIYKLQQEKEFFKTQFSIDYFRITNKSIYLKIFTLSFVNANYNLQIFTSFFVQIVININRDLINKNYNEN
ncbi:hypothetical protein pb186bvf_008267 [Paramecium bursaria]